MKHILSILLLFVCLNSFGQDVVDTLKFEKGFCYHDALSCHTYFVNSSGEEVEFENAYLREFENEDWTKAGVKDKYKNSWFIITYKVVEISEEESIHGEAYSIFQIVDIKLK